MEFIAASESDLARHPSSKNEVIIDRPIDDAKLLLLLEPEGCESDDLGGLLGADQNEPPKLMKHLLFLLGRVPPKGGAFVPYGATVHVNGLKGKVVQRLTFLASHGQIFSRQHPCLPSTGSRRERFRPAGFLSVLVLPTCGLETED